MDIKYADISVKFHKVGKIYGLPRKFNHRETTDVLAPFVERMLREGKLQRIKPINREGDEE